LLDEALLDEALLDEASPEEPQHGLFFGKAKRVWAARVFMVVLLGRSPGS